MDPLQVDSLEDMKGSHATEEGKDSEQVKKFAEQIADAVREVIGV